jgi:hypothetical protein
MATDHFQYNCDRDSNRTYRANVVNTAFGELHSCDGPNPIASLPDRPAGHDEQHQYMNPPWQSHLVVFRLGRPWMMLLTVWRTVWK